MMDSFGDLNTPLVTRFCVLVCVEITWAMLVEFHPLMSTAYSPQVENDDVGMVATPVGHYTQWPARVVIFGHAVDSWRAPKFGRGRVCVHHDLLLTLPKLGCH